MEEWYSIVRDYKDSSERPYRTQTFANRVRLDVFQFMRSLPKERRNKFKQRLGPEFDQWVMDLVEDYDADIVKDILNDDDFWEKTLVVSK
jgi:CO dehydrogenase/acetyl-CoA synthase delta subunit